MFQRKRKEDQPRYQAKNRAEYQGYTLNFLDSIENGLWEREHSPEGRPLDDQGYANLMAGNVASLLGVCEGRRDVLRERIELWADERGAAFEQGGDEDRAEHVASVAMQIGLTSIGNLFGEIPPEAPAFNSSLADEGRLRGWRR